jgi:hypothetical protein
MNVFSDKNIILLRKNETPFEDNDHLSRTKLNLLEENSYPSSKMKKVSKKKGHLVEPHNPFVDGVPALDLPPVPSSFDKKLRGTSRGVAPRKLELAEMPDAIDDLRSFADYQEAFGKTVPEHERVLASLQTAFAWTMMRERLKKWDRYAIWAEGFAWRRLRRDMARLRPAFELMARAKNFEAAHAGLADFLRAMGGVAKKGVVTRAKRRAAKKATDAKKA